MADNTAERRNVSLVGHTDLNGRPGFKMALQAVDDRVFLYLAHLYHSGWSVVDVTDPEAPDLRTHIRGPSNTMTKNIQVADGTMITGLEQPAEGAGPLDDPMDPTDPFEEGAYIWDVGTNPAEPTLQGHYKTGGKGTHRNYYNGSDYAYMAAWPPDFNGGILTVVDISDPESPTEVTRWWWPGQHSTDSNPAEKSFYFHGPAYVQGDRAYLSYGRVGPIILDISNPTDPELLTNLPMGVGLGSFLGTHSFIPLPKSNLAAVSTEAVQEQSPLEGGDPLNYIALVDISEEGTAGFAPDGEPTGPKFLSTVPTPLPEDETPYANYFEKPGRFGPHNLHHPRSKDIRYTGTGHIVTTWFNAGLRIYDISDPLAPIEAGYYVPGSPDDRIGPRPASGLVTHFEDVVVDSRNFIYCTDANAGLYIFESSLL